MILSRSFAELRSDGSCAPTDRPAGSVDSRRCSLQEQVATVAFERHQEIADLPGIAMSGTGAISGTIADVVLRVPR